MITRFNLGTLNILCAAYAPLSWQVGSTYTHRNLMGPLLNLTKDSRLKLLGRHLQRHIAWGLGG